MHPDLLLVRGVRHIARAPRRTIMQNLGRAFVYNVIGIPLTALQTGRR
jgi:cation transport ATPase